MKRFFKSPSVILMAYLLAGFVFLFPKTFSPKFEAIGPIDLIYHYSPFRSMNDLKIKPGSYVLSDQMDQTIPEIGYLKEKIQQGLIPQYSDRIQNGAPFFWVIRHEAKVIPLLLLLLFFPVPVALTLFWILRAMAGGYFFYRFMRNRSLSELACAFGAFAFIFSSYIVQNFAITMAYQYCLLPVGLFAIDEVLERRRWGWVVAFPFIVFQVTVAGYPTTSAYILTIFGIYFFYRWAFLPREKKLTGFINIPTLTVAGLLLSSLALLASKDFFSQFDWGYRENYWQQVLSKKNLIGLFFPFYNGNQNESNWVREGLYVGTLPLLFAFFGITGWWKAARGKMFFAVSGFVAFCFAYDFLGFNYLYQFIPVFNASNPNNLIMLLPVFSIIMATYGFDHFLKERSSWKRALVTLSIAVVCLFWFLSYTGDFWPSFEKVFRDQRSTKLFYIFVASALVFSFSFLGKKWKKGAVALVFVVLFADLVIFAKGWNHTIPRKSFEPVTPGIEYVKTHLGHGKIFLVGHSFLANSPLYFDIPAVAGRGFYSSRSKDLYRVIDSHAFPVEAPTQYIFEGNSDTHVDNPIMEAIGIKYLISDPEFEISQFSQKFIARMIKVNADFPVEPQAEIVQTVHVASPDTITHFRFPYLYNRSAENASMEILLKTQQDTRSLSAVLTPGQNAFTGMLKSPLKVEGSLDVVFRNLSKVAPLAVAGIDASSLAPTSGPLVVKGQNITGGSLTLEFWRVLPIAELLREKYVPVYKKDFTVWENKNFRGRAWGVRQCRVGTRDSNYNEMKSGTVKYFEEIVVADEDGQCAVLENSETVSEIRVERLDEGQQKYSFASQSPFYLVVGDNFDKGWKAWVGDAPADYIRANHNLRAVYVPAGATQVNFKYQPWYQSWGYALMGLGLLLTILLGGFNYRKKHL